MSITLQQFCTILDTFARSFGTGGNAQVLLTRIGFPLEQLPAPTAESPNAYWLEIAKLLDGGTIESDEPFRMLLETAREIRPGNKAIRDLLEKHPQDPGGQVVPNIGPILKPLKIVDSTSENPIIRQQCQIVKDELLPLERLFGAGVRLPLEFDGVPGKNAFDVVSEWNREKGSVPVSILMGAAGTGKTMTTLAAWEEMKKSATDSSFDLWIPAVRLRGVGPREEPTQALADLYKVEKDTINNNLSNFRTIIIDGIDEGINFLGRSNMLHWLQGLLHWASRYPRTRFLLSGRDFALDEGTIDKALKRMLNLHVGVTKVGATKPLRWRLTAWNSEDSRTQMWKRLSTDLADTPERKDRLERVSKLISPQIITTPLMWACARSVLGDWIGSEDETLSSITTEWELMDACIGQAFVRNAWLAKLPDPFPDEKTFSPSDWTQLRAASQKVALHLVLQNLGTVGDEIDCLERVVGGTLDECAARDDPQWEIKTGLLLACRDGKYAHFHENILTHLAASELENRWNDLSDGPPDPPPPTSADGILNGISLDKDASEPVAEPNNFPMLLPSAVARDAIDSDSQLVRTLGYFSKHVVGRRIGKSDVTTLEPLVINYLKRPLNRFNEKADSPSSNGGKRDANDATELDKHIIVRDAIALSNNGLDKILGDLQRVSSERMLQADSGEFGFSLENKEIATVFVRLPKGSYVIWNLDPAVGTRSANRVTVTKDLLVCKEPCTVSLYAMFLQEKWQETGQKPERYPNQGHVGWKSLNGVVEFNPVYARHPVSGISLNEAVEFCRWLTPHVQHAMSVDGSHKWPRPPVVALPSPAVLQQCVRGPECLLWPKTNEGPFGHRHLILEGMWEWTSAPARNKQAIAFGGIGDDRKTGVHGWPDFCREVPETTREKNIAFRPVIEF